MNLRDYQKLIDDDASAKRELARAEGALARDLKRLAEECGCKTEAEAEKLLKKLDKEREGLDTEAERLTAVFRKKWAEKLEEE